MSNDTLPRTEPDAPAPGSEPGLAALGHAVYAFLYNKVVGIGVILAMAIATLLGTVLMQAPDGALSDPRSYAAWLDSVRPRYGGWTDILSFLGMFHVFGGWWFRAITILLAASIIACTTHRMPQLVARALHPRLHVAESFFDKARYRSRLDLAATGDQTLATVRSALAQRRMRVVADPSDPNSLYADRFRFAPFGTAVAHTGFVVILAGVLVSSLGGFSDTSFPATVGQRAAVGHGTQLTVEAKDFTVAYYPDGRPKDYASDLVLYKGDQQVAAQTVRVNEPLRHDGVSFYQSYYGTSALVSVADASGAVLFTGGVPLDQTSTDGQDAFGHVTLPGRDTVVYAAAAASGQTGSSLRPGELQFEIYANADAARPIASQKASQGKPVTIDGLTYTFVREAPFTGLQVSSDPGAPWVWLGSLLTMLGMAVTMFLKHRRLWIRVTPAGATSTLSLASPERPDSVYERWFRRLVTELDLTGKAADRG